MRKDQLERLADLSEALADAFIDEADPSLWPGHGVPCADQDRDVRGDRYWAKKTASATLALLLNVEKLTANTRDALGRDPYDDDDMDKQIASAQRTASRLMDDLQRRTVKAEFDRRAHGKPA